MWKFVNNVLFGKSMEDATKNINVRLMTDKKKIDEVVRSSHFQGRTMLSKDLIAVATKPLTVDRHRAFAVGFTILELSKLVMYKAWYDKITKKFPDCRLIASDTDSFIFTGSYVKILHF